MKCNKCGKEIQDNVNFCPECGNNVTVPKEVKIKRKNSVIPGFRTNKLWKKVVAIIGYIFLLFVLFALATPLDYGNSTDKMLQSIEGIYMGVVLLVIPILVITNFLGIRNKLPLFKKQKFVSTCLGWGVLYIVLAIMLSVGFGVINMGYSDEYRAEIKAADQEREKEEAELAKAEEEKKKAEEEKKRAEEAEKKQKEEEEKKAQKEAEEAKKKAKEEAEAKAKAAEEAALAKEEQYAKENPLSKEYVRWYARTNKLDIHNFAAERLILDAIVDNIDLNEKVYIESGLNYFGRTKDYSKYVYVGELKDNRPDGWGMLFEEVAVVPDSESNLLSIVNDNFGDEYLYYTPIYAGQFEKGKFNGFGYKYMSAAQMAKGSEFSGEGVLIEGDKNGNEYTHEEIQQMVIREWSPCIYEGEFSKGEYEGKGNEYIYGRTAFYCDHLRTDILGHGAEQQYGDMFLEIYDIVANSDEPQAFFDNNVNSSFNYLDIVSGIYKNGKANGEVKAYCGEHLVYEGEIRKDIRDGEGISYFYGTKQKQYDGEWKNGKYHGKGTEYDENGKKLYSGEWKNGDYAH